MKKEININLSPDIESKKKGLRPTGFDNYIGQKGIVDNLKVYIKASKSRNEALDHILLYGPPGLGKTSLALVIAEEMGVNIKITSAPAIEKGGELASILNNLNEGDILFIDEIHRLPKAVEEVLYPAMEDYAIDVLIGKDGQTKSIRLDLPRFTLIGATTRAGMISAPLRDRFGITEKFSYYKPEELSQIVMQTAKNLDIPITKKACDIIARSSKGTPRITNNLVKRCRDYSILYGNKITENTVNKALYQMGIGELGISEMDRLILDTIKDKFSGGPVGLSTLASLIGEDEGTIENVYEPYLIYIGKLARTPRGRVLVG